MIEAYYIFIARIDLVLRSALAIVEYLVQGHFGVFGGAFEDSTVHLLVERVVMPVFQRHQHREAHLHRGLGSRA